MNEDKIIKLMGKAFQAGCTFAAQEMREAATSNDKLNSNEVLKRANEVFQKLIAEEFPEENK